MSEALATTKRTQIVGLGSFFMTTRRIAFLIVCAGMYASLTYSFI